MIQMPVVFVGHGSPTNVIEKNAFTKGWSEMATHIPKPKAILCVSAHWYNDMDAVSSAAQPDTIHDFYGFPDELYQVEYPAPGAPALAARVAALIPGLQTDPTRGLDHGAWSVLHFMYPDADIPVTQLCVNAGNTPQESYHTGQSLRPLREEGVLIIGSGNIVHNLARVDWSMTGGFGWADAFDAYIKDAILGQRHDAIIQYQKAGQSAASAFSRRDHYDPLLYALGAAGGSNPSVFNDARTLGSMSMTSYLFA